MYPKGSVFIMISLAILVTALVVANNNKVAPTLSTTEQTRLEDFQQLQHGDILTDIIEGQVVPVMLVIESHVREVKVELGAKKSTTMKINIQLLNAGKMKIIKRGNADWCYLMEKFYAKK